MDGSNTATCRTSRALADAGNFSFKPLFEHVLGIPEYDRNVKNIEGRNRALLRRDDDVFAKCMSISDLVVNIWSGISDICYDESRAPQPTGDCGNDALLSIEVLVHFECRESAVLANADEGIIRHQQGDLFPPTT